MNTKLRDLVNPGLLKSLETLTTDSVVPKNRIWDTVKLVKNITAELKTWEETRINILKKYVPEGQTTVPPERVNEASSEINAVLDNDVKIEFEPLQLVETSRLTVADLLALESAGIIAPQ